MALGRAIVRKPQVFLFDEPFSNLDAKMRVQVRVEISCLAAQLQTTMIYVTHDQTEAMTMGHRIVCMRDGKIQQAGAPSTCASRTPDPLDSPRKWRWSSAWGRRPWSVAAPANTGPSRAPIPSMRYDVGTGCPAYPPASPTF